MLEVLGRSRVRVIVVGFLDSELESALEERGIETVRVGDVRDWSRLAPLVLRLAGDASPDLRSVLATIAMLYPQVARARGFTRRELAEDASRVLREVIDEKGYEFVAGVLESIILNGRIPQLHPGVRRVAATLGIC